MAESRRVPLSTTPVNQTVLSPDPPDARQALEQALERQAASAEKGRASLEDVAAHWPASLASWAELGGAAYRADQVVQAYAYFRVAYHRGLDLIRRSGWRGDGVLEWKHETNRGFLKGLHGLMLSAAAIGEYDEAARCRDFLLDLDPDDALGVGALSDDDLRRRLPAPN